MSYTCGTYQAQKGHNPCPMELLGMVSFAQAACRALATHVQDHGNAVIYTCFLHARWRDAHVVEIESFLAQKAAELLGSKHIMKPF